MLYKIYVIKNVLNSKLYIGRTYKHIQKRFKEHLTSIHRSAPGCRKLTNAIKKYGKSNFSVELLCVTENENHSFVLEEFFITIFDSILNGYNLLSGGKQFQHTEETKNLISKSMKNKHSGTNNPFYGKTHTNETRAKISKSNLGHPGYKLGQQIHSIESRKKISASNSGSKNKNSVLTEEQVKEIKTLLKIGVKQIEIAKQFLITKSTVSSIYHGKTWKHVNI
jgi:group I intron endonuclease